MGFQREDMDVAARSGLAAVLIVIVGAVLADLLINPMPVSNRDAIMLVVGALLIRLSDVYSYYYGSSVGSTRKDVIAQTQANTIMAAQAALAPVNPKPDVTLTPGQIATVAATPDESNADAR